jgi:hypothetical protein
MFVVMNDKLMTMTSFLRAVRDQALTKEKVRNTVTNLSRNFIRALSPFRKGRFLTGELKRQKKDFLRQQEAPSFWLQTQAESLSYYSQLHQQFIEPRFGNDLLNQWKYQVRTEFIIR